MIKLKDILQEQDRINESQKKVNANAKKLLAEQGTGKLNENWIDTVQTIGDFAGLIPVYGDIIDVINAIIYFIRGKFLHGILSIIAIIPIVGSVVALPFKALIKVLGAGSRGLMKIGSKLIGKGAGDVFAKKFVEYCIKKGANKELKAVVDIVKKHNNAILDFLEPLTKKFDSLHNFNHMLVPNFMEQSIRSMGKAGSKSMDGLIKFFEHLDAAYAKEIKSKFPDIDTTISRQGGRPDSNLAKQYRAGNSVFSKYASKDGSDDYFTFSSKSNVKDNQIVFKRKYIGRAPTNEFSMITTVIKPGLYKHGMTQLSIRLPDHILFEGTNISTDGLDIWIGNLKHGYQALEELFTVPMSSAGVKTELPNLSNKTGKGPYPVAKFDNLAAAKEAKDIVENQTDQIPNAKVTIKHPEKQAPQKDPVTGKMTAPPAGTYTLEVTLPKLQSTTKSINYYTSHLPQIKAVSRVATPVDSDSNKNGFQRNTYRQLGQ